MGGVGRRGTPPPPLPSCELLPRASSSSCRRRPRVGLAAVGAQTHLPRRMRVTSRTRDEDGRLGKEMGSLLPAKRHAFVIFLYSFIYIFIFIYLFSSLFIILSLLIHFLSLFIYFLSLFIILSLFIFFHLYLFIFLSLFIFYLLCFSFIHLLIFECLLRVYFL